MPTGELSEKQRRARRTGILIATILLVAIGILGSAYGYASGWPDVVSDFVFLVCMLLVFAVRRYVRR